MDPTRPETHTPPAQADDITEALPEAAPETAPQAVRLVREVDLRGAQGVQTGDHNTQHNMFR
ncbi:hypothetical protein [Streptomyces sp. NPDC002588]|uniref:hypothetical protein n=1 Tax=Streptomyces sp. NPDC002588 TaxID=3154419 RepID=UPI0033330418